MFWSWAVVAGLALTSAAAADTRYDDEASFRGAAGPVALEDFEDEPLVGHPDGGGQLVIEMDDFTAEAVDYPSLKILDITWFGNHNHTPGGVKYLTMDTDIGGESDDVVFNFFEPISSFGLYLIDLEQGGTLTVNGVPYVIAPAGDGGESFIGIVADSPFSSVHLDLGPTDSQSSMDDVLYSSGGFRLRLTGSCPGRITASASGATPNGTVAYVFGAAQGSTTIPGGPCAGTRLDVQGGVRLVGTDSADGSGNSSLSGNAPAGACGRYLQALDVSPCTTSNVARIQ